MTKDIAILDLPPAPPAPVEQYEVISDLRCEYRASLDPGDSHRKNHRTITSTILRSRTLS